MKRIKTILAKVLSVDEESITTETSPETVSSWDSFNALMIVSELEQEFNVSFTIDEITSVKNVGDIKARLEGHGVTLHDT